MVKALACTAVAGITPGLPSFTLLRRSLSRLSHVARKLEARGWIHRRPSTEDARVTLAEMTDLGMEEVVRIAPRHVASVRACCASSIG